MSDVLDVLYDLNAEQIVLGGLQLDPDLTPLIAEKLGSPDAFGVQRCADMYRVLLSLFDQRMPYDTWLIMDEAKRLEIDLEPNFVLSCVQKCNSSYYTEHYAGIVVQYYEKRKHLAIATEYSKKIYSGEKPEEITAWLLSVARNGRQKDNSQMSLAQSLVRQRELIDGWESPENAQDLDRWSWAWDKWNKLIMPPPKGIITLISAAEGTGKTILGECQAEDWAIKGNNIVFFHFELNRDVMITRRLSRWSGLTYRQLVTNRLTPQERKTRNEVEEKIQSWRGNIEYISCAGWDVDKVINKMRVLQDQGLCDAFVTDYFQKFGVSKRQERSRMTTTERERDNIEQLAIFTNDKDAGARGIVLSQLNKSGKNKSFGLIDGTDLMGSAALSEKANVSIIAHKEQLAGGKVGAGGRMIVEPNGMDNKASMKLVKNTLGGTGSFEQYSNSYFGWTDEEVYE